MSRLLHVSSAWFYLNFPPSPSCHRAQGTDRSLEEGNHMPAEAKAACGQLEV